MIARGRGDALIEHQQGGVSAGDTLTVGAGDVAVFARQGTLLRVLQPGSYQVPAEFAGPDVEVTFVATRTSYDQKFGGTLGAGLPVRTAFGKLAWRIVDPERAVVSGVDGAGLSRFVGNEVLRAVRHVAATIALKQKQELQPQAVIDAAVPEANAKLSSLGVEVVAIAELQLR